jgi:predicted metalloprotease with PDZ domain
MSGLSGELMVLAREPRFRDCIFAYGEITMTSRNLLHFAIATAMISLAAPIGAQTRSAARSPEVGYSLSLDSLGFSVKMKLAGMPDSFRLAMAVHPEYDNKYWRYIHDLRVTGSRSGADNRASIARDGNTLWNVRLPGGSGTIAYRIQLPKEPYPDSRAAWHPFVRKTGALTGGPDTFLYLPDFPDLPATLELTRLPYLWEGASGLGIVLTYDFRNRGHIVMQECMDYGDSTGRFTFGECLSRRSFSSPNFTTLLDSPILLGDLHRWDFTAGGIAQHINYWPLPNSTPFDTAAFAQHVAGIAREAFSIFGKAPYLDYNFLFQDGAWGALEHWNSVTIGLPSKDLAADVNSYNVEIAHEFFHTWNLMALRPAGWGKLSYLPPVPTTGLWWSEGVTMYYAYLLPRRIGFPEQNHTRIQQLEDDLGEYFSNAGNTLISPERASLLADADPTEKGDYSADYYLVGRLIADALGLIISDSTKGMRGMDDVMRAMYDAHANPAGFESRDIEKAASDVCACNLSDFFRDHVREAKPLDFSRYLSTIGLKLTLDTIPEADSAGKPFPDTRIWSNPSKSGKRLRLILFNPNSVWAKAGLHTGMELIAFNGVAIDSMPNMRRAVRNIKMNDVVPVDVIISGKPQRINVTVGGYTKVRARIRGIPEATEAQTRKRNRWLQGYSSDDERPPGNFPDRSNK